MFVMPDAVPSSAGATERRTAVGTVGSAIEIPIPTIIERAEAGPGGTGGAAPAARASPEPHPPAERELVEQLTSAFEANDVDGIVALLAADVRLSMPPLPLEYHGRDLVAKFLAATGLRPRRRSRLIPTRANGQPAFGLYVQDPRTGICHTAGLLVLTLTGDKICAMTGFDTSVPPLFGLPRTLPG